MSCGSDYKKKIIYFYLVCQKYIYDFSVGKTEKIVELSFYFVLLQKNINLSFLALPNNKFKNLGTASLAIEVE